MAIVRNFIQETIDSLDRASVLIARLFKRFRNGSIDKEEFEEEYKVLLDNIYEDIGNEKESPNNGVAYHKTNIVNEYFKENKF